MIRFCFALLLALSSPLAAQELPALYDVYDVASDDVLNIRAKPDSTSEIIGALTPDATYIEVVRSQDGWALINTGERAGWASMRYLSVSAKQPSPADLSQCYGTEPFWSFVNGDEMEFTIGEESVYFRLAASGAASGRSDKFFVLGMNEDARLVATITRATCHDGMSDREFGLAVDLLIARGNNTALYSGCCLLR